MRCFAVRCLVLLLSLALISGNAHAELRLDTKPHEPCPAELGHDHSGAAHHHSKADHVGCCCDCLGCVSAIELTPDLTSFQPVFFAVVFYGDTGPFLVGQVLRPEPGPPRTSALS
jgi:hypothetical protein